MSYGIEQVATFAGATVNQVKRWTDIGLITPEVASTGGRGSRRLYSLWNVFEAAVAGSLAQVPSTEQNIRSVLRSMNTRLFWHYPPNARGASWLGSSPSWREAAELHRSWVERHVPILMLLHCTTAALKHLAIGDLAESELARLRDAGAAQPVFAPQPLVELNGVPGAHGGVVTLGTAATFARLMQMDDLFHLGHYINLAAILREIERQSGAVLEERK